MAVRRPVDGGVPAAGGFYAWWLAAGALDDVPTTPNPGDTALGLLYVGISPRSISSRQDLRGRVLANHIGGNIASSTFRYALAALLRVELNLQPYKTTTKIALSRDDNERLRDWQRAHLALTWCIRQAPWEVEHDVIRLMGSPLNSAGNSSHPFYATIAQRRAELRRAALREVL